MSEKNLSRRAAVAVAFDGVDITNDIGKYLLSLTYTDNEEDETDDLQLKLQDRDGIWREKWLNTAVSAAVGLKTQTKQTAYVVTAPAGLNIRTGPGESYAKLGAFAYGASVSVVSVSGGWAKISYGGKTAYVGADYIRPVAAAAAAADYNVGDEVIANGRPQYTSYGDGTPGATVTNYVGKVTYTNKKAGAGYPIHVGYLGWFAVNQLKKIGVDAATQAVGAVSKGLRISAAIVLQNPRGDGRDLTLDCGQFELDGVSAAGPPATVTIKGTSLPYASTMRQTEKSRSWEAYSLSKIVRELATKNGMSAVFTAKNDPSYTRVEQYLQSDIDFLQKLCRDAGNALKVTNNIIVVFDGDANDAGASALTIRYGKNYINYKLDTKKNNTYTSCRVACTTQTGTVITATAYIDGYKDDAKNNQQLEIRQTVASIAEAKKLAEAYLKLYNKYEKVCAFTLPGDPSLLAGKAVTLSGFGAFDGKYVIKKATHTVGSNGYTTAITLRNEIRNAVASTGSATQTQAEKKQSLKSTDEIAREVIRGDWGNGETRKQKLRAAGYDPAVIQARVNELLR